MVPGPRVLRPKNRSPEFELVLEPLEFRRRPTEQPREEVLEHNRSLWLARIDSGFVVVVRTGRGREQRTPPGRGKDDDERKPAP